MSCKEVLAKALLAYNDGDVDGCLKLLSEAGEYGDDLSNIIYDQLMPPTAGIHGPVPSADNTIAPSLATASTYIEEGDTLDNAPKCLNLL